MGMTGLTLTGNFCTLHGYHWPPPLRTIKHHERPLEYGGPDLEENLRKACDTGHYNVHELIKIILKEAIRRDIPPFEVELKVGTRKERACALVGANWITQHPKRLQDFVELELLGPA